MNNISFQNQEISYKEFEIFVNEISNNLCDYKSRSIKKTINKIHSEEKRMNIKFLDALETYSNLSIPEEERSEYYKFYMYLNALINCFKHETPYKKI
jgi:hypothetical protein